ncbi:MAG: DNA polymerase III subunit alpha [Desulfatiglandaceae bacterium]
MSDFVHLHVHSHYSKGWGTGTIRDLCRAGRDLGFKRLALTDTNGLYGAVSFVNGAREAGITPILGSEVVCEGGRRALLLAKNREGYASLCRLVSDRCCHGRFDLIRSLRERRAGLVVCSDDFTLLNALKCDGTRDLFVEMSPGWRMAACHAFSRKSGIPPMATNRVFLVRQEDYRLHRILRAVDLNTTCSRLDSADLCREHNYLCPAEVMIDHFPHAPEALENSCAVAEACGMAWTWDETVFPRFGDMNDRQAFECLYEKVVQGCRRRYGDFTTAVRERMEHEMKIIREKNFAHYFLVVADITSRVPRSCGRGSAAASIVSYALGITHVDPIAHGLFFERFLNSQRKDPPDIDVDFPWDERERVLDYVFAVYGTRRTAMVGAHSTFGARAAIREVAKVFGLTGREIGAVTGRIGFRASLRGINGGLMSNPKFRGVQLDPPWDQILEAAKRLEGHFEHLSTHCGGVVLVPDEIRRYCPVEISASGPQVLQWDKDAAEEAGLVKIDILGNRSLSVIRDALAMVETNYGKHIDYAGLNPIHDRKAVEIFYRAETIGVFYFESPATRQILTKVSSGMNFEEYLAADHFRLNVIVTSIVRPASSRSVDMWVSRLHGEQWVAPHPLLGPVLDETLGIMVFQEQLSRSAVNLAGFEPGEADTLRKVVSKKHRGRKLGDFHDRFVEGARRRGVGEETIKEVWRMMMGFDGYSFCKPHSASYTLVAYKSAFLRARYPAEFMAAVVSNGGGYHSTYAYLSEARRMGLKVLLPDINLSDWSCTGKDGFLRMGFMLVRGLSRETMEVVMNERAEKGPFDSFDGFLTRTFGSACLHDVRALIKAGCMDGLARGMSRADLLLKAFKFHHLKNTRKGPGLFAGEDGLRPPASAERFQEDPRPLSHEQESFGFLISVHPLSRYRDMIKALGCVPSADLQLWVGRRVTMAGIMISGKTVSTAQGEVMKFVSFEDETGIYEAVFFPGEYRRYCTLLEGSRPGVLEGTVEASMGAITFTVHRMRVLDS